MGRKKKRPDQERTDFKHVTNSPVTECVNSLEQLHLQDDILHEKSPTVDGNLKKMNTSSNSTDQEVTFEAYIPNRERYFGREYFVHSLCHVCKDELVKRFPCLDCQLVTYCSEEHRRQNQAAHKELCAATRAICAERGTTHVLSGADNVSPDVFRYIRLQNMMDCTGKMNRPLQNYEKEIFIFPNVCGTCHCHKVDHLRVCQACRHSAFCSAHHSDSHHLFCPQLLLYKQIVKEQNKFGMVCPRIPNCKLTRELPKLLSMDQVFQNIRKDIDEFEFIELTELVTYPLTALNVLLTKSEYRMLKQLTLHVVGAEAEFETNKIEKWEYYILHLIPGLESLKIEFIGPELKINSKPRAYKVCQQCQIANKSIHFKFHNQLYHTLSDTRSLSKPDLICVFNPGLYRSTGFDGQDTWGVTIKSMFSQKCPILTTAYTHKEVFLDLDRVRTTLNLGLEKEPCLNPFSSLKPNLNFVSDEDSPIIFKNQYFCIMCKS